MLVGLVVFAPLVCGLFGDPRDVAIVGAVAVALDRAQRRSGATTSARASTSSACSSCAAIRVLAVLPRAAARGSAATASASRCSPRSAEIADGTRSLADTVGGAQRPPRADVADICIVDAVSGGELQRLAVRAAGRDGDSTAAALAAAPAARPDGPRLPSSRCSPTHVDDALLRAIADR